MNLDLLKVKHYLTETEFQAEFTKQKLCHTTGNVALPNRLHACVGWNECYIISLQGSSNFYGFQYQYLFKRN